MKKIQVEIEGVTPLLMNNPVSMIDKASGSKSTLKTESIDLKSDADKLVYRKDDGELYIPAEAIKGTMIGASSYLKFGKYSARPMLAGGVFVSPHQVGLGTKDYELDIRTVVIQRNRVVKARPMLKKWKASFELMYNEKLMRGEDLKPILEDAGERVGILDFRPQKLGSFGMFKVTKWKEE